jgi:hypothetical protein
MIDSGEYPLCVEAKDFILITFKSTPEASHRTLADQFALAHPSETPAFTL